MKKFRGVFLKNEREIGLLREANRIVSEILDRLGAAVQPGVQTLEFERIVDSICTHYDVQPAFKGYHGFPHSLCCSVNEEIVHGFPSQRELVQGDIVSFDVGVVYKGFYGDSARTFAVGEISSDIQVLLDTTREALHQGIAHALMGNELTDIARAVQTHIEQQGLSVVKRFVGHGVGSQLHEKPEVPNFVTNRMARLPLKSGMVLAIEPMVTMGTDEVEILEDKWTAVPKDRSLSAHFEHTIAITKDGPEILSVS